MSRLSLIPRLRVLTHRYTHSITMKISAHVRNSVNSHEVEVQTYDTVQRLAVASRSNGYGSSVNGGEMLLLALATCYCNDIYREAAKMEIAVSHVEVKCYADFGGPGEPGTNFRYEVDVVSDAPQERIQELIRHTDQVAEVHNTLRAGVAVQLISGSKD